jgi:hypothetical protein
LDLEGGIGVWLVRGGYNKWGSKHFSEEKVGCEYPFSARIKKTVELGQFFAFKRVRRF